MTIQHSAFFVHDVIAAHGCIGTERTRIGERVKHTSEDGIDCRNRCFRTEQRDLCQISRILNQLSRRPVVRMIIAETVRQNNIRIEIADKGNDPFSDFNRRFNFAVVNIFENLIFSNAGDLFGLLSFQISAVAQGVAGHGKMSAIAVAH